MFGVPAGHNNRSVKASEEGGGHKKCRAIKYIWREDHKGRNIEDLKKSVWYLNRLIKELEEQ